MRIRTVKPAFWTDEKMAVQPEFTRLLALALLNYADDHGYFWANPVMIRGALFPFVEDSTIIRRSLAQLVKMGYIAIGKTPDGLEGGQIIKFAKHQRVDRPQASEIKPLMSFDDQSTNALGLIDDQSTLDRKGKDRKGKEEGNAADAAAVGSDGQFPLELDTPEFKAAWAKWRQHRAEIKKRLTPTSEAQGIAWCLKLGVTRAIAAIDHTVFKGWQGLREDDSPMTGRPIQPQRAPDQPVRLL
jgi:hypothetical protein